MFGTRKSLGVACIAFVAIVAIVLTAGAIARQATKELERSSLGQISLPRPKTKGSVSVEETLARRRSVRQYTRQHFTLAEIGQLLWAGQGVTDRVRGFRTTPSAGATYPLEMYLVAPDGHYRYVPEGHRLERFSRRDLREDLSEVAIDQECVRAAALDVVIAAVFDRTADEYGDRALRYVHLEAGHAAQNILLQATAMDLAGAPVGAFYDEELKTLLDLPEDHEPLYIIALGYPRP
jgi:SagB-type dehydrogenase family enzyme